MVAGVVASMGSLGLAGCSGVDESAVTVTKCPEGNPADFRPVSAVLELRCGTLDCHGSSFRPLRVYSQFGLRKPEQGDAGDEINYAQYFPGGDVPTTDAELEENIRSICGLEPELMTRVVDKQAEPDELLLVKKPRLTEKHKGGLIWYKGDTGDQCVTNWLKGGKDVSKCLEEIKHP
jgi:hypothetical protein